MGRLVPWNGTHTERCCRIERTHRAKRHPNTRSSPLAAIQIELNGFPHCHTDIVYRVFLCVGKIDEQKRKKMPVDDDIDTFKEWALSLGFPSDAIPPYNVLHR